MWVRLPFFLSFPFFLTATGFSDLHKNKSDVKENPCGVHHFDLSSWCCCRNENKHHGSHGGSRLESEVRTIYEQDPSKGQGLCNCNCQWWSSSQDIHIPSLPSPAWLALPTWPHPINNSVAVEELGNKWCSQVCCSLTWRLLSVVHVSHPATCLLSVSLQQYILPAVSFVLIASSISPFII